MPRFFSESCGEDYCVISGADAVHISKSLRMQIGDKLTVCDKNSTEYYCEISSIDSEKVELSVLEKKPTESEPKTSAVLYMAVPKSDKMEFIVQKAVELGVSKIVPVLCARCISRAEEKSMNKKIERYQKIAYEAAKQSGRGIIPEICERLTFKQALKDADKCDVKMLFYENGGNDISNVINEKTKSVAMFIGCEGGFEPSEVELAKENGVFIATLGKRILRCETAPVTALSLVMYLTGNM